jgi:hypothetical protein
MLLRSPVRLADGRVGELASLLWSGDRVVSVRVNIGRILTEWIDPRDVTTRPTQPAA